MDDEEPLMLAELEALRAPLLGADFSAQVLRRIPHRRPKWLIGLWRGVAAAAMVSYLLLFVVLLKAFREPGVPGSLAPRLIRYWAASPDVGPLEGGL